MPLNNFEKILKLKICDYAVCDVSNTRRQLLGNHDPMGDVFFTCP